MNTCKLLLSAAILVLAATALHAQNVSYDDVLLIVNDSSRNSVTITDYFASRRGIPANHIYHLRMDTTETMDSAAFVPLKWKLQSWMQSNNLVDRINYIVTTKGCPLRVATRQGDQLPNLLGGQASFEDCLALINGSDSNAMLTPRTQFYGSRYYGSTQHFKHDQATMPFYLVTRLDGYTVDQVKGYIVKAENPAFVGEGLWVLDVDPGRDGSSGYKIGNDWLRGADSVLSGKGMNILFDTTDTYLHAAKGVIGYASWGSNDGHSGGGQAAKPGNTWLNGAIAETYVSTGGRSFQPGTGYGQSLVADWIAEGASAVKGYTDEPYLTVMAEPDILFDRYTAGFNMAESYWSASPLIAWRQVVIGDPKMRLGTLVSVSIMNMDFGSGMRFMTLTGDAWVHNTSPVPVVITAGAIVGSDSLDFQARPASGAFPVTIAPGDSVAIRLSFRPSRFALETAVLNLRHNRVGDTTKFVAMVTLGGTGTRPVLAATDTVEFAAGGAGSSNTAMLTNTAGYDTISVTKLTISGTAAGSFKVDPSITLPHKILPGTSWDLPISYTPSADADDRASLTVASNATKSAVVRLHGGGKIGGVDIAGSASGIAIVDISPNPFASSAVIRYSVPSGAGNVRLELIDLLGRTVATVVDGPVESGRQTAMLSGGDLPVGAYLCRLTVTGASGTASSVVQTLVHGR
ncbi:MAG: hypothetical protein JWQ98_485 [Chlorobi bacterium]|nr:hypothetical protein [Chlorobiota bacterium]